MSRKKVLGIIGAILVFSVCLVLIPYFTTLENSIESRGKRETETDEGPSFRRFASELTGVQDSLDDDNTVVLDGFDSIWDWDIIGLQLKQNFMDGAYDTEGFTKDDVGLKQATSEGGSKELDDVDTDLLRRKSKKPFPGLTESMYNSMNEIFYRRWAFIDISLEALDVKTGQPQINDMGFVDNVYEGYSVDAPIVSDLISSFNCQDDGVNLWSGGAGPLELSVLVPAEPVIFSQKGKTGVSKVSGEDIYNGPIEDYKFYFQFLEGLMSAARNLKNIGGVTPKLNVLQYGSGDSVALRMRIKLKSGNSAWKLFDNSGKQWFQAPRIPIVSKRGQKQIVITRPDMPVIARKTMSLLTRNTQSTTAAVGYTKVILWFISAAPDFASLEQDDSGYQLLKQEYVVIPVGLGVEKNLWQKFMAYINTDLQSLYSKDLDYTQHFNLQTADDMASPDFITSINRYLCLVQHRATCRLVAEAENPFNIDSAATTPYPTDLYDANDREVSTSTYFITTTASTEPVSEYRGLDDSIQPKARLEIDSCCGHDQFFAVPYDQNSHKCCSSGKVAAHGNECKA